MCDASFVKLDAKGNFLEEGNIEHEYFKANEKVIE